MHAKKQHAPKRLHEFHELTKSMHSTNAYLNCDIMNCMNSYHACNAATQQHIPTKPQHELQELIKKKARKETSYAHAATS